MIDLFKVAIDTSVINNLDIILKSGYVGQGVISKEYEEKLQKEYKNNKLVVVNSGTSAIHLALRLIKDKLNESEDTVLCTVLSCFASAVPILANNLKIKWVDVNLDTCNIDLDDLESKLTSTTRIVLFVHWGGYPLNLDRLNEIKFNYLNKYGKELFIVEDCAHIWKTKYKNNFIGNNDHYCCFSTQAIKFLTTVEGGYLTLPNIDETNKAKKLRWFGLDRDSGASFRCVQNITDWGYKFQPNDVFCSIGIKNIELANKNVQIHIKNANLYNDLLKNISGLDLLKTEAYSEPTPWLYTVKVDNRKKLQDKLLKYDISSSPVHARMDAHDCVKQFKINLPNMDILENTMLCIPVGFWVTEEEIYFISKIIKEGW